MQSLQNIQGTKDAGFEWHQLLARVFKYLGMKPNSTCKGVWVWMHKKEKAYLALATDNILYMSTSEEPLNILLEKFSHFFVYEVRRGNEILFLNYRIIQTEHSISID